ncbi:MAG: UDP-N-acetylmuramoyl-L-alanyl-D-glutamate--2,6-diaminopimelate ligase [Mucispirillum sp.]|nr:UDP-N-acetylmuramoyl-L-alanyl-D-glutamate--2,6-diaminopimelate ligase [Mucispirillum sp.]
MTVKELLDLIPIEKAYSGGKENTEIASISADSSTPDGTIFFAYKVESYDSNKDVKAVFESGKAEFIICEEHLSKDIPHAVVKNGRHILPLVFSKFYGEPLKKYKSMAVTGTNGKTTSAYIMDSVYRAAGLKSVRIGTTGILIDDIFRESSNTTPSPQLFYAGLSDGLSKGCSALSMEVSSHALAQGRLNGAFFDTAVFTNLTGDHLDFHKDMEEYFKAKSLLFTDKFSRHKIINIGREYGERLAKSVKNSLITFSVHGNADIYPVKYVSSLEGIKADISVFGKIVNIRSDLIGEYNLENILGVIGAAHALGFSDDTIVKGIENLKNVPGRLEKFSRSGITAFVDYAHTDDALINAINALRRVSEGRIITVFGAGGDRDAGKRPRMGKAAAQLSDIAVITSDNPRTEDPDKIIADIAAGAENNGEFIIERDREKAIAKAVDMASEKDIVFIAGKGHEDYQIIGKTKYHFDDREIVRKYLGEKQQCL